MRIVGLLVACGGAACYSATLPPGAPCPGNSNDECPSGQFCSNGVCTTDGTGDNGGSGPSGSSDDLSAVSKFEGLQLHALCLGAHTGDLCHANGDDLTMFAIGGDASRTYQVKIRVRGVAELSVFENGAATPSTNWYVGSLGTRDDSTSDFSLAVTSPFEIYHLNSASSNSTGVALIDYSATFPIHGGSTVTYNVDTGMDGMEALNLNASGTPIIITGVTTTPSPYDGQFLQINVERVQ